MYTNLVIVLNKDIKEEFFNRLASISDNHVNDFLDRCFTKTDKNKFYITYDFKCENLVSPYLGEDLSESVIRKLEKVIRTFELDMYTMTYSYYYKDSEALV